MSLSNLNDQSHLTHMVIMIPVVQSKHLSPMGSTLASAHTVRTLRVYEVANGKVLSPRQLRTRNPYKVNFMKTCPHDINPQTFKRGKKERKKKSKERIILALNKSKSISDPLRFLHCDIILQDN